MIETELTPQLRPATDHDSRFVYETKRTAIGGYIEAVWGKWDDHFQNDYHRKHFDPSVTRIITLDQTDIGVLTVRDYPDYQMIESIYLLPPYQHRGLGTRLISEVLHHSRDENLPVRLHVLKINPAVDLYNRLKFRIIAETDNHYIMEWSK